MRPGRRTLGLRNLDAFRQTVGHHFHEPTGDLDSHSATEILEILKRLNEDSKKTIVMVTHDPHAASYAHVSRHLEKGKLLPPG